MDVSDANLAPAATDTKAEQKTSWRDLIKIHPAAELFPMMSEEELKELGEDIKANGLKLPLVFYDDGRGGEGISLLDGRNRLDAMALVGYHLPLSYRDLRDPNKTLRAEGPDGKQTLVHMRHEYKDPLGFAISANLRRRQLTTAQKSELIAKLLKEKPERSDRATAEIAKVSPQTVTAKRREMEAGAQIEQVTKRTGSDGKVYPKTKAVRAATEEPKKPAEPSNATPSEPTEPTTPTAPPADGDAAPPSDATAEPTMEQFVVFWERASNALRNEIAKFVQKKTVEARKRQVDEMVKDTMRPPHNTTRPEQVTQRPEPRQTPQPQTPINQGTNQ
jgi:ParB-like chromosome segregation protein Spo0J